MKFSSFKPPKHRTFGYIPRHYDPEKEELAKRVKRYEAGSSDKEIVKERIADGFRQSYVGDSDYRRTLVRKSNYRLIFIILGLLTMSYLLVSSNKITKLIELFEG